MVRGLYTSASGALVAQAQVDNIASNLANVDTSGFKQTLLQIQSAPSFNIYRIQTDPGQSPKSPLPGIAVQQYVGPLGTGALVRDTPTDFQEGALQSTGNKLDLAITGNSGAFFTVQTPNGIRYTRNGEFVRDAGGVIRTQDGDAVLGSNGAPIQTRDQGSIDIANDGTVTQHINNATVTVGQLQITQFNSLANLRPEGSNLFAPSGNAQPGAPATYSIQQGFLEKSNGNVVRSMVDLITAERWFSANEKSIKTQDDATQSAILQLAKTPNS
ncbi:MAG TPA: flagellar basal-body rod protein FlgF [Candidatus Aquilonibacter sp.]|nr:flagellar basal-body rod protein FlgF [Candidatus Aquilonibacter sp.]